MPTWACFRCLAASSPHSLMLDMKNTPLRHVLRVQHSPRPIFDVARRVSPLLVMSNTHFAVARRVNTLVVTSKPNPPYPGHRYGFWAGDPNSTRTHTRLPAWVCKPVTNPTGHENTSLRTCFCVWCERELEGDGFGQVRGMLGGRRWGEVGVDQQHR